MGKLILFLFIFGAGFSYSANLKCGTTFEGVALSRAEKNEIFARKVGLHYQIDFKPAMTRKKVGKRQAYFDRKGKEILDEADFSRIRALNVPPGYHDVWISEDPVSHIQAIGLDKKGKAQYRYHPKWNEAKRYEKFERVQVFGKALPKMFKQVEKDLSGKTLSKRRVMAAMTRLLSKTQIRIGSVEFAEENETYGLTTLLPEHVEVKGKTIRLIFTGKSGVSHDVTVEDWEIARVLKEVEKAGGPKAFSFMNEEGAAQAISADDVNRYLKEISDEVLTAKDFRTWAGTLEAFKVYRARSNLEDAHSRKAALNAISTAASEVLRNKPATALKHYIHPKIIDRIESGKKMPNSNKAEEEALLDFLEE